MREDRFEVLLTVISDRTTLLVRDTVSASPRPICLMYSIASTELTHRVAMVEGNGWDGDCESG